MNCQYYFAIPYWLVVTSLLCGQKPHQCMITGVNEVIAPNYSGAFPVTYVSWLYTKQRKDTL